MNEISQELRKEPQLCVITSSNAVQIQTQIKKDETRSTLTAGAVQGWQWTRKLSSMLRHQHRTKEATWGWVGLRINRDLTITWQRNYLTGLNFPVWEQASFYTRQNRGWVSTQNDLQKSYILALLSQSYEQCQLHKLQGPVQNKNTRPLVQKAGIICCLKS